jgi:hypothetical protein
VRVHGLQRAVSLPTLALALLLAGCGSSGSAPAMALTTSQMLGPTAAATGSEATPAFARCRVDNAAWRDCASPFAAFGLSSGSHTIDVEAAHGGVSLLRRPAMSSGDRVASVAFANTAHGPARATARFSVAGAAPRGTVALTGLTGRHRVHGLLQLGAAPTGGSSRTVLVDFYVDGSIVGTAASAPWRTLVDFTRISPGRHELRVVAVSLDRRRRASLASSVTVTRAQISTPQDAIRGNLQAAVDTLGPDGGTLRLPAGRFDVANLRLGSGVRLIGAGAAKTILVAPTGAYDQAISVTGNDVLVSDLTIDARGSGSTADDSAALLVHDAEDVVLRRLRLVHLRGYGVHLAGHHQRISLQQSTLDGAGRALAGLAEWAADSSSGDVSVVRCVVRRMREYGITIQSYLAGQTWPDRRALVYGNDVSRINHPTIHDGTIEIGVWATGIGPAVLDNVVRDTGWDGIETVVNASDAVIAGNLVRGTRTGIYAENVTRDTLIEQNDIADISVAGINLEPQHNGPKSGRLTIRRNRIVGAGEFGIGIGAGTLGNSITGNQVLDTDHTAILMSGTSANLVEGNDLSDGRQPSRQVWCVYDPQPAGSTASNRVEGNDCSGSQHGGTNDLAGYSARRGATP